MPYSVRLVTRLAGFACLIGLLVLEQCCSQVMMGGDMNGKLTKEVICHACGATVKEINKALKLKAGSKRPEAEVMDIISDVCKMDSFKIYDYPPPKMIRACQKVMDTSEELLEQLFTKRPYLSEEEIEEKGCKKACKGVDKTKDASSRDPDVYVDGVPQKLGSAKPDESKPKRKKSKKKKSKKKKKKKSKKKKTKKKTTKNEL